MNNIPNSALVGIDPANVQPSDFQSDEIINGIGVNIGILPLPLLPQLKRRKIYTWVATTVSNATDNYFKARINFLRNQQKVGSLPLSFGNATSVTAKLQASIATVSITGGLNLSNCLGLSVATPSGTQPANLILQPQTIIGVMDQASIQVDELWNVTAYRIFFAIISSN